MFRAIVLSFVLLRSALAGQSLDVLVNASAAFSAAILLQLNMVQGTPSAADLAEKTISYAVAKTAYYEALRAAAPELTDIATGREARPPELDNLPMAFSVVGAKQEAAADEETVILLKRFSGNPDIEKARAAFDQAQKVEERFHKDFDGQDFTLNRTPSRRALIGSA
jgi:hypothetical protein